MKLLLQYALVLALGVGVIVFTLFGIYAYIRGYPGKWSGGAKLYYITTEMRCFLPV